MGKLACLLVGFVVAACGRSSTAEYRLQANPANGGAAFANALYQAVGATMTAGNRVEVANNGAVFDAEVAEIGNAQSSVNIEVFIWSDGTASDRLITALAARTKVGVACRVVVDAAGSPSFGPVEQKLNAAGCETLSIRPVPGQDDSARMHRKIMVVDGRVGITGGFGIDDKWLGDGVSDSPPQWRDSNVVVHGPAVRAMQQAFAENWQEAGGELLPLSDFPEPSIEKLGTSTAAFATSTENSVATRADRLMQLLLASATRRIWLANAYFVPSKPIMELLERKAGQGVDVRILAAGDKTDTQEYLADQRSRMDELSRAGVQCFEYAPVMMHSKTVIVDDALVLVGSINLDALSLNKQDEGSLVVEDAHLATLESMAFLDDLAHATRHGDTVVVR